MVPKTCCATSIWLLALLVQSVLSMNMSIDNNLVMDMDHIRYGKGFINNPRGARLFSFQSTNDDIEISLEFGVPFIKIPVKRAIDNFHQGLPVANVNFGGAVLAGAIGFGALIVIPGILNFFKPAIPSYQGPFHRALPEQSEWWRVVQGIEETLLANNIDSSVCMQKAVCSLVKSSTEKVARGEAESTEKLIDGIVSNNWMKGLINGTSIESSIKDGQDMKDCSRLYSTCKLNEITITGMMKKLSGYIKVN